MILRWAALALICAVTIPTHAHKLQYSTSELIYRVDDQRLEVIHSIHLDDAIVLLAQLGDLGGTMSLETRARIMLYVEDRFFVSSGEQQISLEPVGAQIEGDALWIYQEATLERPLVNLVVRTTLMHDVFEEQKNQINLIVGDEVRSLELSRDEPVKNFS